MIDCSLLIPMVTLAPRGWTPDPNATLSMPPQSLIITHDHWAGLGQPDCIEAYWEAVHNCPKFNTVDFRGWGHAQV